MVIRPDLEIRLSNFSNKLESGKADEIFIYLSHLHEKRSIANEQLKLKLNYNIINLFKIW